MFLYKFVFIFIVASSFFSGAPAKVVSRSITSLDFYPSYSEILEYLESLAEDTRGLFRVNRIGRTFEGRDIVLVRASNVPYARNPVILVDGGAHAREWVTIIATLTLLEDIRQNPSNLLQYADWYVIPVVNPDGYEYSRLHDRYWRKNRANHFNATCLGVDINRNYNFHWAETGISTDPCDHEIYPGMQPFSEVESVSVAAVMTKFNMKIKLYMTIHSFGNYMVYPYGYTDELLPESWRQLDYFAKNVTGEIYKATGEFFKVMSAGEWYPSAGGSDDYALAVAGIPYSYTVEITKDYGFEYPEELLQNVRNVAKALFKAAGKRINMEFGKQY